MPYRYLLGVKLVSPCPLSNRDALCERFPPWGLKNCAERLVRWLSRPRRYTVGCRPSLDSHRTAEQTGLYRGGDRCSAGRQLLGALIRIARNQLVFYS
jgi:hypothetical protein